ncbi:S8 family peptidase [Sphingomicrobium aestuariivivum]|uniref:S8 family peptidase n=1 Tax=Sphingomicrobium aestuariivivum TaxID=1582356 RepID=UPI001FD68364|nr:S8 family peptidase [Sphingomicrobium aestuariivivum]MCJ8191012.1 S8 family serine peptidase [Sphingomicrobium aestuariivivum]
MALAFALAACGGSSPPRSTPLPPPSSNNDASPPPEPAPAPAPAPDPTVDFDTAEYRASTYLGATQAIGAYEAGASGEGIGLAVIDTGINPSLSAFAGRVSDLSRDVAGNSSVNDVDGHGTAVTAVAAAARDGSDTMGVAYEATILAFRADDPGSCADTDGCLISDSAIANGIDAAVAGGARVINISLGGGDPGRTLQEAVRGAAAAGVVIVVSAGNDGEDPRLGAQPDVLASAMADLAPGLVIIAGALGSSSGYGLDENVLADYSNHAGSSADHYLAALGTRVRAPDHTGQEYLWSGTSFSAPVISGAVALMAQAFPNLSGREIVEILFNSADDLGAAGVDGDYGNGRLNITAAFAPQGQTSLAGTGMVVSIDDNGGLPAAAGDGGGPDAPGGQGTLVTDRYDRAYAFDPTATLARAPGERPLGRALAGAAQRSETVAAGPVALAMTIEPRTDTVARGDINAEPLGLVGAEREEARLLAARMVARIDDRTAVALGFAQGAGAMQRQLEGVAEGDWLAARREDRGFAAVAGEAVALSRDMGAVTLSLGVDRGAVWSRDGAGERESAYASWSLGLSGDLGGLATAGVKLTQVDESETLLGARVASWLGGGEGARSRFLDARLSRSLGPLDLSVEARRGWTDFAGGALETSAYGATIASNGVFSGGDRLALRLAQPLRVEAGGFDLWLPTAWDYASETATFGDRRFSLSPSGREWVAEVGYGRALAGGWLSANAYRRSQPGHVGDADADLGGAIRYSLDF